MNCMVRREFVKRILFPFFLMGYVATERSNKSNDSKSSDRDMRVYIGNRYSGFVRCPLSGKFIAKPNE